MPHGPHAWLLDQTSRGSAQSRAPIVLGECVDDCMCPLLCPLPVRQIPGPTIMTGYGNTQTAAATTLWLVSPWRPRHLSWVRRFARPTQHNRLDSGAYLREFDCFAIHRTCTRSLRTHQSDDLGATPSQPPPAKLAGTHSQSRGWLHAYKAFQLERMPSDRPCACSDPQRLHHGAVRPAAGAGVHQLKI
jgi:hypothetical protein